jgi:beta-1,4-mannooligosaccharide/beta-1,4-mannosyl-N-acetylglucosamine phosphorylase
MSESVPQVLKSSPCIRRCAENPVLAPSDIPYEASLVFNAGVTKYQGRYVMVFRDDYGWAEGKGFSGTHLGLAFSDDGVAWDVEPKPCLTVEQFRESMRPLLRNRGTEEIHRAYDPRLTVLDGRCYLCFAVESDHGIRGGIAVTDDFRDFELLSLSVPDNRNMVLFPERVDERFVRLERPFPIYGRGAPERFDVWLSRSPDLVHWGEEDLVLGVEDVPFSNRKIGPGAPPVRTPQGWLTTFHAVDFDESRGKNGWEPRWQKRYTAGVMLLDLDDPRKLIGLCEQPLLSPEADYETSEGYRCNVIFPGGMILEPDGEVKIYYGAADTVECLASAHVDDLLALCKPR